MRILIIGLGSIAKKHVTVIKKLLPSADILALRSSTNANAMEGVINIIDIQDAKDIDFAIISTPTYLHRESIQQALLLKCPLFIEKPLYHTLEVINEVEQIKTLNYIACNLRFLDSIAFLKREIELEKRNIHEVNIYCGSYLPNWRPGSDYRNTYSSEMSKGGGVHLDLIHELDYIYWLCGAPNKVNSVLKSNSELKISSIDYANYCLEYDSFCVSVVLNYYRRVPKRTIEVLFDDCTWVIDLLTNTIYCNDCIIFESNQRIIDTYEMQMAYFIKLVENQDKVSNNSIREAYNVLKICLNQ